MVSADENDEKVDPPTLLSTIQQKEVDAAFENLFGYPWGTTFFVSNPESDIERTLCTMLGPSAAGCLLNSKSSITRNSITKSRKVVSESSSGSKRKRVDVSKGASRTGQNSSQANSSAPKRTARRAGGVDSVLKGLEAKKSTVVAKTSDDWEKFKDQTGLSANLESQADSKRAYLKKQAFLNRVDHREFEIEKKERDSKRAQRK